MPNLFQALLVTLAGSLMVIFPGANHATADEPVYLSPAAIAASPDGRKIFVACATARQLAVLDPDSRAILEKMVLPDSPSGIAVSRSGTRLYVTCAAPESVVCVMDPADGKVLNRIAVGHTAMSPILSLDERRLYVCDRFNHDISVIDLDEAAEIRRVRVSREPVAAALTPDGRHLLARYYFPTTEVDFGRINSNALSFIDLERMEYLRNVFLDQARRGAGNPWGVAWTPDGKRIVVTLAGTHELCLVDAPLRPQQPVTAGVKCGSMTPRFATRNGRAAPVAMIPTPGWMG